MGLVIPKAAWAGTLALAFSAGIVNAIGYLGFEHQALSHLTGTISLTGIALEQGRRQAALELLGVVASFVIGAGVGGAVLVEDRLSPRYVIVLATQGALLSTAAALLMAQLHFGASLAAAACGLQNAATTIYSGAAIRTTHLTGFFTDVGITLGRLARGLPIYRRRLTLWLAVIVLFALGGWTGAILFGRWSFAAMFLPAGISLSSALALALYLGRTGRAGANG